MLLSSMIRSQSHPGSWMSCDIIHLYLLCHSSAGRLTNQRLPVAASRRGCTSRDYKYSRVESYDLLWWTVNSCTRVVGTGTWYWYCTVSIYCSTREQYVIRRTVSVSPMWQIAGRTVAQIISEIHRTVVSPYAYCIAAAFHHIQRLVVSRV